MDLYSKPTDTHQYLHSSSCHPRHCKTGIAYSQALRLRRICSNDSDFHRHTRVLANNLVARGYSSRQVNKSIAKAHSIPRNLALQRKSPGSKANPKVPLVTSYNPCLPPLGKITKENHHILHTSDRLASAIPDLPVLAFRRPRNLRDLIVRAEVPLWTRQHQSHMVHLSVPLNALFARPMSKKLTHSLVILRALPTRPMALSHAPPPTSYTSSPVEFAIFSMLGNQKLTQEAYLWP
jgi:hypothetical protein